MVERLERRAIMANRKLASTRALPLLGVVFSASQ
jgi:hypothetical protein